MHLTNRKRIGELLLIPTVLWTLVIFWLSTAAKVQHSVMPDMFFSQDKWGHFGSYALLCLLWYSSFFLLGQLFFRVRLLICIACIAYGLLLEYVQFAFFPDRYFEWGDALANTVGVLIAAVAHYLFFRKTKMYSP